MTPDVYSFGLTGYPLQHSLSPRLHQAALKAMRVEGEYRLYPVPPLPEGRDALVDLLEQVRSGALKGLNVTVPHKITVLPFLDDLTPTARRIGAVNTITCRSGRLLGDNTDAPGFLQDFRRFVASTLHSSDSPLPASGAQALVLGGGGAARAVVYALAAAGCPVAVATRRPEQAIQLVTSLQSSVISDQLSVTSDQSSVTSNQSSVNSDQLPVNSEPDSFSTLHSSFSMLTALPVTASALGQLNFTILVNATPLGMWPQVQASPWLLGLSFPAGVLVYDLVYNPPETALVRAARSAGLAATTGLGMLVEQAALALERWTELPVPRVAMWEAVKEFQPTLTPTPLPSASEGREEEEGKP